MEKKEVKLAVNNLKISFRTDGGKVQAVRDISFNLYKGETLAIVGESGSGKSVTTRAVLGILANNAIKEGGQIIYDGQDLMKIPEEVFHTLRGDKISMIFQDPLSSLNPIMRIGKQMTEAMIIKGRLNRKNSRKDFNSMLARVNKYMNLSGDGSDVSANKQKCNDFNKFEAKHAKLEFAYNDAKAVLDEVVANIDDVTFRISKNVLKGIDKPIIELLGKVQRTYNPFLIHDEIPKIENLMQEVKSLLKDKKNDARYHKISLKLTNIKDILKGAIGFEEPNFFSIGYYLTFSKNPLPDGTVRKVNLILHKYLDDNFMLDFIETAKRGVMLSNRNAIENKKKTCAYIDANKSLFANGELNKKAVKKYVKELTKLVTSSIDKLDVVKDNVAYTFGSTMASALELYFGAIKRNKKEESRYAKQKASYDRLVARGKTPTWQVIDKDIIDLDDAKDDIVTVIDRIYSRFDADIKENDNVDFDAKTVAIIDYLKDKASNYAYRVTHSMAKSRALKLLEEVGIPEPKKRYMQYPFEFSGGMRQRIVIAIALSANPDILICDEPTTALDVTIQSQILELIKEVKKERDLSVIFITHDLGVVANMADRVAVMYAGKIVEIGTANDIFYSPAHPYTWALLSSMPDLDTKEKLESIPGTPPNMIYPPKGDAFAERNKYAMQIDLEEQPPMFKISDTHYAATWLLHPNAPKINPPKAVTDRIKRMRQKMKEAKNNG